METSGDASPERREFGSLAARRCDYPAASRCVKPTTEFPEIYGRSDIVVQVIEDEHYRLSSDLLKSLWCRCLCIQNWP
jgi:hypothetical protein